jgi:HlyD family secretion protein
MAVGPSLSVLRDIETLFDDGAAGNLTDRQLLDRFASRHDAAAEAAFEVLVRRHGPMVLQVCHNLLHDANDARDAFQATFLVLVRRSGSIQNLDSVGGWLYGVACRVAARARVDSARRRSAESRAALRIVEAVDPPDGDEIAGMGFGPIVQEEVRRLPEKYRAVVVTCYWHGLTQEQAALRLGCPLGTVRSRMARARNLLRRRLIRRGLAPLAGGVTAGLDCAQTSASTLASRLAPVPPELVRSTIEAAVRIAGKDATAQIVSGVTTSLVPNVLWSSTMVKFTMVIVGVVFVGLIGSGGWIAAPKGPLAQAQPSADQKTAVPGKKKHVPGAPKIYSLVQGQKTMVFVVPDGSPVKKGNMVCQLDSASLKDQLVNQKITSKTAEAKYVNSKLVREVAEIALVEYMDGVFQNELLEITGAIKIAEAELALAEDELKMAREIAKAAKTFANDHASNRANLAKLRAQFALEKAQSRRKLLVDYTRGMRLKTLKSDVEKARSEELAQKAVYDLEQAKEKMLVRQILNCDIVATTDGTLVYAARIEEGATVRERQILFEIAPIADTKVEKR